MAEESNAFAADAIAAFGEVLAMTPGAPWTLPPSLFADMSGRLKRSLIWGGASVVGALSCAAIGTGPPGIALCIVGAFLAGFEASFFSEGVHDIPSVVIPPQGSTDGPAPPAPQGPGDGGSGPPVEDPKKKKVKK